MPRFLTVLPRSSPTSTRIDLDDPTPSLVADPEPAAPTPPTPLQVAALRCAVLRCAAPEHGRRAPIDKRKRADPSGPAYFLQAPPELAGLPCEYSAYHWDYSEYPMRLSEPACLVPAGAAGARRCAARDGACCHVERAASVSPATAGCAGAAVRHPVPLRPHRDAGAATAAAPRRIHSGLCAPAWLEVAPALVRSNRLLVRRSKQSCSPAHLFEHPISSGQSDRSLLALRKRQEVRDAEIMATVRSGAPLL